MKYHADNTISCYILVFYCHSSCFCSLPHGVETSLSRLLHYIMSASSTLDLCVFAFSNMDLCRAVLALHRQNVTIRILTDKHYSAITGSQIGVLRKAGKGDRFVSNSNHFLLSVFMLCDLNSHSDLASLCQETWIINTQDFLVCP